MGRKIRSSNSSILMEKAVNYWTSNRSTLLAGAGVKE
jgi:hypothetical protein